MDTDDDIFLPPEYFQFPEEEYPEYNHLMMEALKWPSTKRPDGSKLSTLVTPEVIATLRGRPAYRKAKTWVLAGLGATQFSQALEDAGKTIYVEDLGHTLVKSNGTRYPRSRHIRIPELEALLLGCRCFSVTSGPIRVELAKNTANIIVNLFRLGKITADTYVFAVSDPLQKVYSMPVQNCMPVHDLILAPYGNLECSNLVMEPSAAEK